jgi:hypothetical protein
VDNVDGRGFEDDQRGEGSGVVCLLAAGASSFYRFIVQGGGHGRVMVGMELQRLRGVGEGRGMLTASR